MSNLDLGTLFWDYKNVDRDTAYRSLIKNKPSKLYKYRSDNKNSIDDFKDDKLWFNNPNNYNDPFDTFVSGSLFNNAVEQLKEDILNRKSNLDKMFGKEETNIKENELYIENFKKNEEARINFIKTVRSKFRVSCFSQNNDSILMWSHYSNSHKGFCLEYDFKMLKEAITLPLPVKYSNDLPNNVDNKLELIFTKSKEWSYEEEWRLVKPAEKCESQSNIIAPIAIYLGSNMDEHAEKSIIEIAKGKNIKIYKMYLKQNEFKLEAKLIWEPTF